MRNEATPAISRLVCLYLMSGVWGKENFDHTLAVSRGRSILRWPSVPCVDSERWISCSTESFEAVPSAARHFSIISKPVETISSIFLQDRDVKCQGTATAEAS